MTDEKLALLIDRFLDMVRKHDLATYNHIMAKTKDGNLPAHISKLISIVFVHLIQLSQGKEQISHDSFMQGLKKILDPIDSKDDLIWALATLPKHFIYTLEQGASDSGGKDEENFNKHVKPFFHKLSDFLKSFLPNASDELKRAIGSQWSKEPVLSNDEDDQPADKSFGAADIIIKQFVAHLKQEDRLYSQVVEKSGDIDEVAISALRGLSIVLYKLLDDDKSKEMSKSNIESVEQITSTLRTYIQLTDNDKVSILVKLYLHFIKAGIADRAESFMQPRVTQFISMIAKALVELDDKKKDNNDEALGEIKKSHPEVAEAITQLLNKSQACKDVAAMIKMAVRDAIEDRNLSTKPFKKFVQEQKNHDELILLLGFLPTAYGKLFLNNSNDESAAKRIQALALDFHGFAKTLTDQATVEKSPAPSEPKQTPSTRPASGESSFAWANYSGFSEEAKVADVALNKEAFGKYKLEFILPEYKKILEADFGEYASAISMDAVNQYSAWTNGDGAENKILDSLAYYDDLMNFIASGKDRSSENTIERLTFIGALLSFTAKKMPEMGKRTKAKFDSLATALTDKLTSLGYKLEHTKSKTTNVFGLLEKLLG